MVSRERIPGGGDIPPCHCGLERRFEFQVGYVVLWYSSSGCNNRSHTACARHTHCTPGVHIHITHTHHTHTEKGAGLENYDL